MNLPTGVLDLINKVYAANMQLATTDDGQRQLAKIIAEQVRFTTRDEGWGVKSSSPSNPQGPSQLAYNNPQGKLYCWRWLDGQNAGKPNGVLDNPIFLDITGQNFIPVVPTDHLGTTASPPQQPTNPLGPSQIDLLSELKNINDEIGDIKKLLEVLGLEIDQIRDETIVLSSRRYTAKIFGATVVFSPEK